MLSTHSAPPISPSTAPISATDETRQPGLLATVRERLRVKHYSLRAEEAYLGWIKRFVWFHGKRHPKDIRTAEVEAFLTDLAVQRNVASSTQNQALAALLFCTKRYWRFIYPGWMD